VIGVGLPMISENSIIGKVIMRKGMDAGELMDKFFCEATCCCPGTTERLGHAAELLDKTEGLPGLIQKLNELSDISNVSCE
jgi:hypothetical protein